MKTHFFCFLQNVLKNEKRCILLLKFICFQIGEVLLSSHLGFFFFFLERGTVNKTFFNFLAPGTFSYKAINDEREQEITAI